jgi:hypothetical protein
MLAVLLLFPVILAVACSRGDSDALSRAKEEATEAKEEAAEAQAALAKLQAETAKFTKADPGRGKFVLEGVDFHERVLTDLHGKKFEGDVFLFRCVGRGVPQCRLVDEKGKTELGPVPETGMLKATISTNRNHEDAPNHVLRASIALVFSEGKVRLLVVAGPVRGGRGGAGFTASVEDEFHRNPMRKAIIISEHPIPRDVHTAGKDVELLEYDGRKFLLHFYPGEERGKGEKRADPFRPRTNETSEQTLGERGEVSRILPLGRS